jgi:poly(3-hydroxybutyrate) depolymerase/chitodextrinase
MRKHDRGRKLVRLRSGRQAGESDGARWWLLFVLAAFVLMPACGGGSSSGTGNGVNNAKCATAPGAPTNVTFSNTTSSATTLNWTAPTPLAANCQLTGYTIYENGTSIGTSTTTSFNVTSLSPATTYSFTVTASDAAGLGAQSSAASVTTTAGATTTSLVSSQNPVTVGQPVTFTASVTSQISGTVTGNITFYSGTTMLGVVPLSAGTASLTTSALASGTDAITATYAGASVYAGSTSSILSELVVTSGLTSATLVWDGITRYYQVYLPAVLPSNPPMLLMLHGTRFDVPPANPSTVDWGWQPIADKNGLIVVQPASTLNTKTGQWNWNAYFMDAAFTSDEVGTCTSPPATACPDDAGFLRQLITNLIAEYNANPNQVFVTGMSSGGQMTERVGVELSDIVAAIAPTSGQMVGQQVPPPDLPGSAAAPISVQEWHGTVDTELPPCNDGTTVYSNVTYTLDTVDDTFNYWVTQDQCTSLQTTGPLCTNGQATSGLSGNVATGCAGNNVEVQFIWEQGVGHNWNSANNDARWQFLSSHPKQSSSAARKR